MTKDINVQAQQRLGEIIEARAFDRFGEVWAEDVIDHDPAPDQAPGIEGIVAFWKQFTSAFPDLALEPQILTADDDSVSAVFRITGTHTGDFQGHGPTGNTFEVRGIQVAKFRDGKIAERWGSTDEKGLAEQLKLTGGEAHFVTA
ncbi:ester cyclase [Curtobacterium sp. RRHDQ10]|uniref:ester cyclase n=1 Tax=Curtobacterium phyllosphaerae TaxID=3413379 RepID=UPI003BF059E6